MAQFGNEVAELFAFLLGFRRSDEQFDGQVRAVVEVVVFTQRAVPGCFDGQRRNGAGLVEADTFVDDILIAPHIAVMDQMEFILEERRQFVGCDRVGDDSAAGIIRRQDGGHHGDEGVAVDFFPIGQDGAHAVHVGVENEAQVGFVVEDGLADRGHGIGIFRVGDMVGEHAIRFEELAARRIGAEFRQDLSGKEPAAAVAGVDDDVHPFQRTVVHAGTEAGTDLTAQVQGVEVDQIQRGNGCR